MSKQTTNKPITTKIIKNMKGAEKISMLTAYDYSMAKLVDRAGIDMILVGDSLGNVMLGFDNTPMLQCRICFTTQRLWLAEPNAVW